MAGDKRWRRDTHDACSQMNPERKFYVFDAVRQLESP
jgi:hypothetical protein